MTWLPIIRADEASGDLQRAYDRLRVSEGSIGLPFEGLTHNGSELLSLIEFAYTARFGASELSRLHQEMIATYVSALNGCVF